MASSQPFDLSHAGDLAHEGARRGLRLAGEHVLEVGNRHVPTEDSDLERSGQVDQDDETVAVSYGRPGVGKTSAYAVHQHEDLSLEHDSGRSAKWLERAMTSERDEVLRLAQREVQRALDG